MNKYRMARINKMVTNMVNQEFQPRKCKHCGSYHIVRFGHNKQRQRLLCRDCGHTFMDNEDLPSMKTSAEIIASAVGMFYEGMSLNAIRRQIQQTHGIYPSDSTVYEWIRRYTKSAIDKAQTNRPQVGDVWVADETVLKIGGKNTWYWDIIDTKTRFLLASRISTTRGTRDAYALVKGASERAGKTPKVIVTDKLAGYIDGIELAFGADTKHIRAKTLTSEPAKEYIERFHGTLKDRTKVMRGLKSRETAEAILDGWLTWYNFMRPHEGLDGHTPAEKAGIKYEYKNWLGIVNASAKPKDTINQIEPRPILRLHHPSPLMPKMPRITPELPRITSTRTPRITPKPPRLGKNELYIGRGGYSRHPFRGAKKRRIY